MVSPLAIISVTVSMSPEPERLPDSDLSERNQERPNRGTRTERAPPPFPDGAEAVSGRGQFLMPGFWDMTSISVATRARARTFPLLLADGITGVRDMALLLDEYPATCDRKSVTGWCPGPRRRLRGRSAGG